MKIYTRTGDKGETSLFGGKRVKKDAIRVEAYGTIDELNSAIGLAIAIQKTKNKELRSALIKIQEDLFEIGAVLATPESVKGKGERVKQVFRKHLADRVGEFEELIDELTKQLPSLKHFILPGVSESGATLHLARSISRRAERRIVTLAKEETVDEGILIYMNRLSDLLFTIARFINKQEKVGETNWKGIR